MYCKLWLAWAILIVNEEQCQAHRVSQRGVPLRRSQSAPRLGSRCLGSEWVWAGPSEGRRGPVQSLGCHLPVGAL